MKLAIVMKVIGRTGSRGQVGLRCRGAQCCLDTGPQHNAYLAMVVNNTLKLLAQIAPCLCNR